jgi:hypothetical protein
VNANASRSWRGLRSDDVILAAMSEWILGAEPDPYDQRAAHRCAGKLQAGSSDYQPPRGHVSDFDEFKSYYTLADKLMGTMTPEQLADCLRILALQVADYRLRFGEIPGQDLLAPLGTTEISDNQARVLREGMEVLVGYLASVRDGWEEGDAPLH